MIGAALFKSGAEKLAARLADLEAEAAALEKRAEEARAAEAEAQGKLVSDLAEGLPVDDWRKKRDAAEKRAADAAKDLAAAREAAELVRGRLEETRRTESLEDLHRRYEDARRRLPEVRAELVKAGNAFSRALSRHEALRREESSVFGQLRAAGDREVQLFGVPIAEDVLSDELPALNGGNDGRARVQLDVPIWPDRAA